LEFTVRHIILGAGPAGVIAAETIRKRAPYDQIILVGDEPEPPYSRMAIPYLLIGHVDEAGTYLRKSAAHFREHGIELRRARCTGVDAKRRSLELSDGSVLTFDTLLIATGSKPARPPIPGIDADGVNPCWTLADARQIMARAKPGARVLQMGAGFIGCIIMEALAARGVKLTVVEMGDRMVPRMMGPTAGSMIKEWCEKKGVRVFTGARVESIEPARAAAPAAPAAQGHDGGGLLQKVVNFLGFGQDQRREAPPAPLSPPAAGLRVKLSNGQVLDADLVISATGVKPNVAFLAGSGITCVQGVLTDEQMQTNVPGIYAAGDCAEAFDKRSGRAVISAIQPNASDQAYIAAMNMVGRGARLKQVTQINVLDTLGLISTSFGEWEGVPGGEHIELTDRASGRHLSLQFKGDVMVGCNSIGWTDHVGVMRGLVEGQVRLGQWKDELMRDPTQLMPAYLASAQAQSAPALVRAH
jgi:NADPH-dependent 2,4-dienoyl-CoA reductase/sulfur reductase-like enzyme